MRQRGFTMMEVIIAISIFSIMMLLSYSMVRNLIETKVILDNNRDAAFLANSVLERLAREIQLAASTKLILPPCGQDAAAPNAPKTSFLGEEKSVSNGARGDTITFLAREGGQYVPDGGRHTGTVQISYRVEPDPEKKSDDGMNLLIREEMPLRKPVSKACESAIRFPITQNLVSLEFKYFDGKTGQWSTTWMNANPPSIVQFRLALKAPDGIVRSYTSAVAIRQ